MRCLPHRSSPSPATALPWITPHGEPPLPDPLDQLRTALGDRYVLGRELGGGAMSRVFVAEETGQAAPAYLALIRRDTAGTVRALETLPGPSVPCATCGA